MKSESAPAPPIVRSVLTSVVGRMASAILTLVTVLLATRLLAPEEYGHLALVMVASAVAYSLMAGWNLTPAYVLAAEELQRSGAMSATAWARVQVVGFGLCFVALLASVAWMSGLVTPVSASTISAWIAATLGYVLVEFVTTLLETRGHYPLAAVLQSVRLAAYALLLLLLLARRPPASLDSVLLTLTVSWTVAAVTACVLASRLPIWPPRPSAAARSALVHSATPLIVFAVSQLVFGAVDLVLVEAFMALRDVGHYALAYQAFAMGSLVASAALPVAIPRLARTAMADPQVIDRFVDAGIRRVLPVASALLAICVPFIPPCVTWVFGEQYSASAPPMVVLMLGLVFSLGSIILSPVISVGRRFTWMSVTAAGAVAVDLALGVILLGVWEAGLLGIASATVAATLFVAVSYAGAASPMALRPLRIHLVWLTPIAVAVALTLSTGFLFSFAVSTTVSITAIVLVVRANRSRWRMHA